VDDTAWLMSHAFVVYQAWSLLWPVADHMCFSSTQCSVVVLLVLAKPGLGSLPVGTCVFHKGSWLLVQAHMCCLGVSRPPAWRIISDEGPSMCANSFALATWLCLHLRMLFGPWLCYHASHCMLHAVDVCSMGIIATLLGSWLEWELAH
jgi:hypothetical protein